MTRNAHIQGWIAGALTLTALAAIATASFSATGLQLESGGVEMTLKSSLERGVQIQFIAPE
ncbi:MAG: hypothetical protein AAF296_04060 [Pseudomonadota bacterium]